MSDISPYLKEFERFERRPHQPSWVFPLRKAGMARFAEAGFPTMQDEDWRFTNLAPLTKLPFKPTLEASRDGLPRDAISRSTLGGLETIRLVFVDGHFVEELSEFRGAMDEVRGSSTEGIIISSLGSALESAPEIVQKHMGRMDESSSFAALNTAFFQDGGFVYLPRGASLQKPVHFLFISTSPETGATSQPRNLIVLEPGAGATIFESYVEASALLVPRWVEKEAPRLDGALSAQHPYFTNALTELVLGEGAVVEHCKIQDESPAAYHIAAIHATLGRACNLISHSLAFGSRLSRNNIRTALAGEGVECVLNGLYLTADEQLADHHMVVEHAQPRCNSHEYYNGILDGRSKGVFHGRILVRPAAQKTDAKQTNKNLLLSEDATVDTKPQLEIYADDVKCTHGATVGQLNEESIFYLRSRGIGEQTARRMIIHAFAGEIMQRIRHAAAREELDALVWDKLEANPHLADAT